MCESRGSFPGLTVPFSPSGLCGRKAILVNDLASEPRSCVKVEVAVLGCPVPNGPHGLCGRKATVNSANTRVQELCESRVGRPGLSVPNS